MSVEQVTVIAPKGLVCPMETQGRITDAQPVTVPLNRFYRRLLADGSLLRYQTPSLPKKAKEK